MATAKNTKDANQGFASLLNAWRRLKPGNNWRQPIALAIASDAGKPKALQPNAIMSSASICVHLRYKTPSAKTSTILHQAIGLRPVLRCITWLPVRFGRRDYVALRPCGWQRVRVLHQPDIVYPETSVLEQVWNSRCSSASRERKRVNNTVPIAGPVVTIKKTVHHDDSTTRPKP